MQNETYDQYYSIINRFNSYSLVTYIFSLAKIIEE
jgi:hypothetical protein